MKKPKKKAPPKKRLVPSLEEDSDGLVFVQVRAENPLPGFPKSWQTLTPLGGLGGWTLAPDGSDAMNRRQAREAVDDWKATHREKAHPWHYRVLHVEVLATHPKSKAKRGKKASS